MSNDHETEAKDAPKIEFPCEDYPIKVVGSSGDIFRESVVRTVEQFDSSLDKGKVSINLSRNGKYQSVRLLMRATGEAQLKEMFEALKTIEGMQIVL